MVAPWGNLRRFEPVNKQTTGGEQQIGQGWMGTAHWAVVQKFNAGCPPRCTSSSTSLRIVRTLWSFGGACMDLITCCLILHIKHPLPCHPRGHKRHADTWINRRSNLLYEREFVVFRMWMGCPFFIVVKIDDKTR